MCCLCDVLQEDSNVHHVQDNNVKDVLPHCLLLLL